MAGKFDILSIQNSIKKFLKQKRGMIFCDFLLNFFCERVGDERKLANDVSNKLNFGMNI